MSVSLTLKRSLLSAGAFAMTALPGIAFADSQPVGTASMPTAAGATTTMAAKTPDTKAVDAKASTKTNLNQAASVPTPAAPTTKVSGQKAMPISGTDKPPTSTDTNSKL